jgi:hypothetical protein
MEQQFPKEIEFTPDVRTNVSARRADFYGATPGRIQVGCINYATGGSGRSHLARNLGIALGLLVACAAWFFRP